MSQRTRMLSTFLSLAVLLMAAVTPAAGAAPGTVAASGAPESFITPWTGQRIGVGPQEPGTYTDRGSGYYTWTGLVYLMREQTSDARITGFNTAVMNIAGRHSATYNRGTFGGTFRIVPDAYPDSAWEGTWSGWFDDPTEYFRAVGFGTGKLAGLILVLEDESGQETGYIIGRTH